MKTIIFIVISVLFLVHRLMKEYEAFEINCIDDIIYYTEMLIPRIIIIGLAYIFIF